MKLNDLDNYSLQVTEKYQRYYYSSEAQLIKNETTEYELKKGTEIPTSCGFLEITDYLKNGDDIIGIRIDYYDDNSVLQSAEITLEKTAKIRLMEGSGDIYRVSDCTFKIIEK